MCRLCLGRERTGEKIVEVLVPRIMNEVQEVIIGTPRIFVNNVPAARFGCSWNGRHLPPILERHRASWRDHDQCAS